MKGYKQNFFLFFYHLRQFFFIFPEFLCSNLIIFRTHLLLQLSTFLFELFDSNDIPFNLVIDNPNSSVSDLVGDKELVEDSEVAVCLENIQKIKSQLNRLFVIVSKST